MRKRSAGSRSATTALAAAAAVLAVPAAAAATPACPTTTDAAEFPRKAQLRHWNQKLDEFGARPTGSASHRGYVRWLDHRLDAVDGVDVRSLRYRFDRQLERSSSLRVELAGKERKLKPAAPVPYSEPTSKRGASAPLVHLPSDTEITAANAAGKIVVRDFVAGELQNSLFEFVSWSIFDPEGTFTPEGVYKRDFLNSQPVADMEAAGEAGAAGVLFVHEFPREVIRGHYRPYEGVHWEVPALHLGVDEGKRVEQAIADGTAGSAAVAVRAKRTPRTRTRTLVGRLPGPGERRVVVETHSDGMNAVWDNGHVPVLAIARYFAALPRKCRPGPMEFVFTTAHLYQRLDGKAHGAGDELYARKMDSAYDRGKVALILALEHVGAREWEAVPRGGGLPGLTIRKSGLSEPSTTFVTESEVLVGTLEDIVRERNIGRSLLLKGTALADDSHVPPYCSFGGEGTPYMRHLLPTVGFVTSPWPLFNPGYGMELIDVELLRRQSLMFNDFLLRLRGASQDAIAGEYMRYRAERAAGKPTCFDIAE